jgi:hypothetical protein
MMKLLQEQICGTVALLNEPLLVPCLYRLDSSDKMAEWCDKLHEQMASANRKASRAAFRVAVIGPMKAGKSTSVNRYVLQARPPHALCIAKCSLTYKTWPVQYARHLNCPEAGGGDDADCHTDYERARPEVTRAKIQPQTVRWGDQVHPLRRTG